MINRFILFLFFMIIWSPITIAQETIQLTGVFDSRVFLANDRLPFWMYTNSQGFLFEDSSYGVSAFAKANYSINNDHSLDVGLGGYISNGFNDSFRRSDLYIEYTNKWFNLIGGAKSEDIIRSGLSTINQNILVTGNARPFPGVLLSTNAPIKLFSGFSLDLEIAHFELSDARRTKGAKVHYKRLGVNWDLSNNSKLSIGLRHYVQWGGTLENGFELPDDFNAFVRVFSGANGGDIDNPNEAINALGNHLGSYSIQYNRVFEKIDFELYHQTLFDDRSGRELNNIPDGVWGAYITFKNANFIKGVLYEYVQTVSQSGRPVATGGIEEQQSGGDNYFINGVYPSGWTYEGRTIGLPFINPINSDKNPENNRSIAHHFGVFTCIDKMNIKGKLTYLQNLGTYRRPFENRQKQILSYLEVEYITKNWGSITLYSGIDILNDASNNYGIGIGYSYNLK